MREIPVNVALQVARLLELASTGQKALTMRMLWCIAQGEDIDTFLLEPNVREALQPVVAWLEKDKRIAELELERESVRMQNNSLLDRLSEIAKELNALKGLD